MVVVDPRSPWWFTTFRGWYSQKQPYTVSIDDPHDNFKLEPKSDGSYVLHYTAPANATGGFDSVRIRGKAEAAVTDASGNRVDLGPQEPWQNLLVERYCPTAPPPPPSTTPAVAVSPITAVFTQATYSTAYCATIDNPSKVSITTTWSGPDCGTFTPSTPTTATDPSQTPSMVWSHPHPPCDATTNHQGVSVHLDVTWPTGGVRCTYQGAESGLGPACVAK